MSIAPFLFSVAHDISFGNVHASDESHFSVYDTKFPVVAVVHFACESRKSHRHECFYQDAGIAHAVKEFVAYVPASHVIVYESYLHTFFRLVYQYVCNQVSQGVSLHDICAEMDALLSFSYFLYQFCEEGVSVGVYVNLVVFEWQRPVLRSKELYESLAFVRNLQVFLYGKFKHRAFRQQVKAVLAYKFLLSCVLSEEEIEYDTYYRHEHHRHDPSHGFHWLSVVHEHCCYSADNHCRVDDKYYPVQVYHIYICIYIMISFPSSLAMVLRSF